MLDENGRVIEEGPDPKPQLPGEKRTFRVLLDCNQYHADMVGTFNCFNRFNYLEIFDGLRHGGTVLLEELSAGLSEH